MQSYIIGFIIGLLSGVAASAVWSFVHECIEDRRHYRKSPLTGEWEDEIWFEKDPFTIEKRDRFFLRHNTKTNKIEGEIKRYYPSTQNHREWYCSGKVDQSFLLIYFWSKDLTQRSNGSIYAKLQSSDRSYQGYYLEEHKDGTIDKTPIRIYKR